MAWIKDLTSKAERVLNKIDESAAVALNNVQKSPKHEGLLAINDISVTTSRPSDTTDTPVQKFKEDSSAVNVSDIGISINSALHEFVDDSAPVKYNSSIEVTVLQNEVLSLTKELSLLLQRVKSSEEESKLLRKKLESVNSENLILQEKLKSHGCKEVLIDIDETSPYEAHKKQDISQDIQVEESSRRLKNVTPTTSNHSLENEVHSLTTALREKQCSLELLLAQKTALQYKFDVLQKKHSELLQSMNQHRGYSASVNDTDDAKARLPNFLKHMSTGSGMARSMKRAYSTIDWLGIKTGVFIRRYPLFRISLLVYITVMHTLVLLLLFSYMPEAKQ